MCKGKTTVKDTNGCFDRVQAPVFYVTVKMINITLCFRVLALVRIFGFSVAEYYEKIVFCMRVEQID